MYDNSYLLEKLFDNLVVPVITKICLYNFDPLKPHFYIVKLGLTGVYIIFLISAQNNEAVLTSTHNLCFEQKYDKVWNFSSENFHLFGGKIFSVFEKTCSRNVMLYCSKINREYSLPI